MPPSTHRRLRLSTEILQANVPAEVPCNHCLLEGIVCFVMPNSGLKCAECTRLGRACVNLSWESLDRTRDEYQKKVDEDEKLLSAVIARLLRNKKILAQAKERARKKALCLASEMEALGELDPPQQFDCPAASIGIAASPTAWATLGLLDDAVASLGSSESTASGAGGSS